MGIPGSLWQFAPDAIPGRVHFEKMKVISATPEEKETSAQATAVASVGDINVTVNMPPPSVVVASTQSPEAAEASDSDNGTAEPLFAVEHWSQLAIGIDEKWRFWAITPAPATGEIFKKTEAAEIKLPGDRWKAC